MKTGSLILLPLLLLCRPGHGDTVKIEAETNPTSGDLKILTDTTASEGKAVSIARDWQPLFSAAVPPGDVFTLWVRYKGGSILAKKLAAGTQTDLKWSYDKPGEFTWKKLGRFAADQLGDTLLIIRGGGGGEGPVLDAVIFASDDSYEPTLDKALGHPGKAPPTTKTSDIKAADGKIPEANPAGINEGAALALGMVNAPKGTLVEAEAKKPGGTNEIVEIAGASGGKAVTSSSDYQNVFQSPLPVEGDAWRIFVRHKGGPFAVKLKTGDRWFFRKPGDWTWTETDVFSTEDLGTELRIGRSTGGDKNAIWIDAVVFAPEKKRPLPADKPNPDAAPQRISLNIDWSKTAGTMPAKIWGINEHEINDPKSASDPQFQKLLGELKPGFIRIHQAGLLNKWTNASTRDWDVEKIRAGFAASTGYGDAKILLCLDQWPSWLSKSATLEPEKYDEFASLCAKLVRIMRDDVKRKIDYYEITNERETTYAKAGKLPELFKLYAGVAAAMRDVDANVKLGGLAFTWGNPRWVGAFLATKPDIDFLSWHNYGTGDLYEGNDALLAKANSNVAAIARGVLEQIRQNPPAKPIETFMDETNVKYTWDPFERRHQNVVGTLFHASVVHQLALLGISGVNLWQEHGTAYGSLIDGKNTLYPSYTLYQWAPRYLVGNLAAVSSGNDNSLEVFAVTSASGARAVLLLNKSDHNLLLPPASSLLPGKISGQQINAMQLGAEITIPLTELPLPGYSLTLLTSNT